MMSSASLSVGITTLTVIVSKWIIWNKEVKDLQMDLLDVETTLQINKDIINALTSIDPTNNTKTCDSKSSGFK